MEGPLLSTPESFNDAAKQRALDQKQGARTLANVLDGRGVPVAPKAHNMTMRDEAALAVLPAAFAMIMHSIPAGMTSEAAARAVAIAAFEIADAIVEERGRSRTVLPPFNNGAPS